MTALETICEKSRARGLAFLVCGCHAVMAHGFARSTFDLDLLVRSAAREAWKILLHELGWQLHAEGTTFLQFDSPPGQLEPVDLMLVNDATFAQMSAAALPLSHSTGGANVVSLLRLVALKFHAIKHGHAGRVEKDLDDVIQLVKANHLSLEDEKLRGIILRHGIPELYESSNDSSANSDSNLGVMSELEFPDWSGMSSQPLRLSFEQMFRHNEKLRLLFPPKPGEAERRLARRCTVEFIF